MKLRLRSYSCGRASRHVLDPEVHGKESGGYRTWSGLETAEMDGRERPGIKVDPLGREMPGKMGRSDYCT